MTFMTPFQPDTWLLLAQTASETDPARQGAPGWTLLIWFGLLGGLFYFMLIRPANKARRDQEELIRSVKTGDRIYTVGGIVGTITNVKQTTVMVRVADGVKLEILKDKIGTVVNTDKSAKAGSEEAEAEDDEAAADEDDNNGNGASASSAGEATPYNRSRKRGKKARR